MRWEGGGSMVLDELTFGAFREIAPNIMEIIINEGVELSGKHIEQIEEGLLEKYNTPYALLINRVKSYSHTHASMQRVAKLRNLAALAIVVHSGASEHAAMIHGLYQDNIRVFDDKDKAATWLRYSIAEGI
jgi:hypothetical protein